MTASQLIEHKWLKDDRVFQRLSRAYSLNNINDTTSRMDDSTDDLEKTLVNVSIHDIHEDENPPKRQKLR